MYINRDMVVEAILYNANDKEIINTFPDFDLKNINEGNMIVKISDDKYKVMSVSDFNKTYVKIEQIINNNYVNNEILQENTGIDNIE